MRHLLKSFGHSDIGSSRKKNEDVWLSLPDLGFFALADGMGGHNAGEIAAQETIDFLSKYASNLNKEDVMECIIEMRYMIEMANRRVFELGEEHPEYQKMGTTLCCLLWTKDRIIHAHVGDSRVYRFRNGTLSLLTQDHSLLTKWLSTGKLAQECETPFPYKHVITRSIGSPGKAHPEIALATYQPNDLFFLCSDGVSDVLSLSEMEKILTKESDPESATRILIETAKIKGSSDNMTIVMVCEVATDGSNLLRQ